MAVSQKPLQVAAFSGEESCRTHAETQCSRDRQAELHERAMMVRCSDQGNYRSVWEFPNIQNRVGRVRSAIRFIDHDAICIEKSLSIRISVQKILKRDFSLSVKGRRAGNG